MAQTIDQLVGLSGLVDLSGFRISGARRRLLIEVRCERTCQAILAYA